MDYELCKLNNEEFDCRIKAKKITSEEDLRNIEKLFSLEYAKRVFTYCYRDDWMEYNTQGVINTYLEKCDLETRYRFLNSDFNIDALDFYENLNSFIHKRYGLQDEEKDMFIIRSDSCKIDENYPDLLTFKDRFREVTNHLLDDLDWSGIVVAGGVVSSILFNNDPGSSDIDIFFVDNGIDVQTKVKHIIDTVKNNTKSDIVLIKTKNTLTVYSDFPNRQIQIVMRICRSVYELLTFFDLDSCCVAYNGERVLTVPRFIRCFKTRTNFVDYRKLENRVFRYRIEKYLKKGFNTILTFYGMYPDDNKKRYIEAYHKRSIPIHNHSMYVDPGIPYGKDVDTEIIKNYVNLKDTEDFSVVNEDDIDFRSMIDTEWRDNLLFIKDNIKSCYMCKEFYINTDQNVRLCDSCCAQNSMYKKIVDDINFRDYRVVITGGRDNIGYELGLYFLRHSSKVLVTTRFPKSCLEKYRKEKDSKKWIRNLTVYGVDFLVLKDVNNLIDYIKKWGTVDILINNAAQTFRRSREYYKKEIDNETLKAIKYDKKTDKTIVCYNTNYSLIPEKGTDTWTNKIDDVSDTELVEVNMINVMVPFKLIKSLRDNMASNRFRKRYIINVSSPEGQFSGYKNSNHPHTNMAKASLNMLTRTVAEDYKKSDISMFSADTGWVSKMTIDGSKPPLNPVDAVQRVLYPIHLDMTGYNVCGRFFREFEEVDW